MSHMKPDAGRRFLQRLLLPYVLLAASCSTAPEVNYGRYIPFTRDLIATYSLSEEDIRNLQFYVSRDIVLRREMSQAGANVAKGKLFVADGKSVDEVEVPQYAPGVADTVDLNSDGMDQIHVRFEKGAPAINFIARVDKPRDSFGLTFDRETHRVRFGDLSYKPVNESLHAILLVDKDTLGGLQSKQRILKGLLLPDTAK